jgi:urea transporter
MAAAMPSAMTAGIPAVMVSAVTVPTVVVAIAAITPEYAQGIVGLVIAVVGSVIAIIRRVIAVMWPIVVMAVIVVVMIIPMDDHPMVVSMMMRTRLGIGCRQRDHT